MADYDRTFFQSIPWCASLINDPEYVGIPTSSRVSKDSTEDALFGDVLKTDTTISACLSLYKKPDASTASIVEVTTLLTLESGLNGYAQICHGGIIATILDEVMGLLLSVNRDREAEIEKAAGRTVERMAEVTAELTVKYLKPVTTSGFPGRKGANFGYRGLLKINQVRCYLEAKLYLSEREGDRYSICKNEY